MQQPVTVRRIKAGAPTVTRQEPAPFMARRGEVCGFGVCERKSECTSACVYRNAFGALPTHTQTPAEREQAQREAADEIRAFVAEANSAKIPAAILLGVFLVVIIGAAAAAWGA